ncbi:uncharacterized protein LOC128870102 [Anastrepha ludens]|uniref:uncharacterized protein LOC128870102 n=1 Tax=Anastrepha ludens TaxID=28586 RepID=UPI0023B0B730|nr:uncharacterized protein LOC128870102 [Anastrepha ludens]
MAGKNLATKPAILGTTYKAGYLVLHCKESTSAEWVKAAISNASPWEGATLWATEKSKIPHSRIAVGYFPNSVKVETAKILDFVQGQNKGLNFDSWRLLKRAEKGSDVTLVVAVDQKSAANLKEYNGRVNYHFIQVTLRLKSKNITTEELVDQMEAVELQEEDESPPKDSENKPTK